MNNTSTGGGGDRAALEDRLGRLSEALGALPEGGRRVSGDDPAQLFHNIDEIAARVQSLTALLAGSNASGWDVIDHITAQTLLRDLAVIARDLRHIAARVSGDLAAEEPLREVARALADITREMEIDSAAAAAQGT